MDKFYPHLPNGDGHPPTSTCMSCYRTIGVGGDLANSEKTHTCNVEDTRQTWVNKFLVAG